MYRQEIFVILLLLLLLLKHVTCDLLLIYGQQNDSYHLECLVNEEDPAIYLYNPITDDIISKQTEFEDSILLEDFEGDFNTNEIDQYWGIRQYPNKDDYNLLKPVNDYRWELFDTLIDDTYLSMNETSSFSIELTNDVLVKFNTTHSEIIIEAFNDNSSNIESNGVCFKHNATEKWLKFQVHPYNETKIVILSNNQQCYYNYSTENLYQLKNDASNMCKIEKYSYLWTNKTRAVYNISFSNNTTLRTCILFHTTMCRDCSLFMELRNQITTHLITDELFTINKEFEWETKKFCHNSELPTNLLITFITSGDRTSNRTFWAIDDVRLTSPNGKRILKQQIIDNEIFSYNCGSIDPKIRDLSIVNETKLTCNRKIKKYCDNYINCTACYRRNNQIECCKTSKITLTDEIDSQLVTTTNITSTITTTEGTIPTTETETTTIDYLSSTTTETPANEETSTAISNTTIPNEEDTKQSKFNTNYLYLLLLLIPIAGLIGCVFYKMKKSREPEIKQPENDRLTTPEWLYNEPEYTE